VVAQHRGGLGKVGRLEPQTLADAIDDAWPARVHGPAGYVRR
jgi:hypothetical protein